MKNVRWIGRPSHHHRLIPEDFQSSERSCDAFPAVSKSIPPVWRMNKRNRVSSCGSRPWKCSHLLKDIHLFIQIGGNDVPAFRASSEHYAGMITLLVRNAYFALSLAPWAFDCLFSNHVLFLLTPGNPSRRSVSSCQALFNYDRSLFFWTRFNHDLSHVAPVNAQHLPCNVTGL